MNSQLNRVTSAGSALAPQFKTNPAFADVDKNGNEFGRRAPMSGWEGTVNE